MGSSAARSTAPGRTGSKPGGPTVPSPLALPKRMAIHTKVPPGQPSEFPSGSLDGNGGVPEAETSDFSAMSSKTRLSAEAYSPTPHKGIRWLTCLRAVCSHRQAPRLQKSAVSGREQARTILPRPIEEPGVAGVAEVFGSSGRPARRYHCVRPRASRRAP